MPARDGTGPNGLGAETGGGLGVCTTAAPEGYARKTGYGYGRRCGCGRALGQGFGRGTFRCGAGSGKEFLTQQRDALRKRAEEIDRQLETM